MANTPSKKAPLVQKEFSPAALQAQIDELMDFKNRVVGQQIQYPLDNASQTIIYNNVPLLVSKTPNTSATISGFITVTINGRQYRLLIY